LDEAAASGSDTQDAFIDPIDEQRRLLAAKPCACPIADT
jgi:hypothetical protein